jgi:hypothetical protein
VAWTAPPQTYLSGNTAGTTHVFGPVVTLQGSNITLSGAGNKIVLIGAAGATQTVAGSAAISGRHAERQYRHGQVRRLERRHLRHVWQQPDHRDRQDGLSHRADGIRSLGQQRDQLGHERQHGYRHGQDGLPDHRPALHGRDRPQHRKDAGDVDGQLLRAKSGCGRVSHHGTGLERRSWAEYRKNERHLDGKLLRYQPGCRRIPDHGAGEQ